MDQLTLDALPSAPAPEKEVTVSPQEEEAAILAALGPFMTAAQEAGKVVPRHRLMTFLADVTSSVAIFLGYEQAMKEFNNQIAKNKPGEEET